MRHHYVPQFLLRRWCDDAGRLHALSVRDGRVTHGSSTPRFTGYEDGLYAVADNPLGIDEDHLERRLFSPLDSGAAAALSKIERHQAITGDDRIAWAFFLNSLRMRQPDVLAHIREEGRAMLERLLAEGDADLPEGASPTFEWFNRNHPGLLEARSIVSWLPLIVKHGGMVDRFAGLDWWVLEFAPETPKLLLSDLPVHWEGGVDADGFLVHLPIAPDRLFVGTASAAVERRICSLPRPELVRRVNRASLASMRTRVWAADAAEGLAIVASNTDVLGANVERFGDPARRGPALPQPAR